MIRAHQLRAAATHPLARNFSALALGNLGSRALLFLVNVQLARVLLPEVYGKVVLVQALLLLATVMSDAGVRAIMVRDIASHGASDDRIPKAWGTVLALSLAALTGMLILGGVAKADDPVQGWLILLFALGLPVYGLNLDWLLKGYQRFGPVGMAEAVKAGIYLLGVALLVRSPDRVLLVPLVYVLGWLVAAGYVAAEAARAPGIPRVSFAMGAARQLVVAALPVGLTALLTQLYMNGGILFLEALADSSAVGLYGAAFKLTLLVTLFGGLFGEALLPTLSRRYRDPEQGRRLLLAAGVVVVVAGVGAATIIASLAGFILSLVYGDAYVGAEPILVVLALSIVPLFANIPFVNLLIVQGRQRLLLPAAAAGLGVNIALNLLLIPSLGPLGAALAELGTETTVAVAAAVFALNHDRAVVAAEEP